MAAAELERVRADAAAALVERTALGERTTALLGALAEQPQAVSAQPVSG